MSKNYEVGRGKPPKEYQFRKGKSGNPSGRPPNTKRSPIDVAAILDGPVTVSKGGTTETMSAFEARVRNLARRAIKDAHTKSAIEFVKLCVKYDALNHKKPLFSNILTLPKGWEMDEFLAMLERYGPPPWPGERTGLTKSLEAELRKRGEL